MRRMWPVILAVVLVLSMNVGPAMALTTKRLWQASVGTNAVNGRMSLRAYTNSTGLRDPPPQGDEGQRFLFR